MKIILMKDVEKIGKQGQVREVKNGYFRNFLYPRGLAVVYNQHNQKLCEERKKVEEKKREKKMNELLKLKEKISSVSCTIPVEIKKDDMMYGSITSVELVRALADEGFELDKKAIELPDPIKSLGIYEVPVHLGYDVKATIKVWVVKK